MTSRCNTRSRIHTRKDFKIGLHLNSKLLLFKNNVEKVKTKPQHKRNKGLWQLNYKVNNLTEWKIWTEPSWKIHKWSISRWKDALHQCLPRKGELKPRGDTTSYLLEWLKFKNLIMPSGGEAVEQLRNLQPCCWGCKMIQPRCGSSEVKAHTYYSTQQFHLEVFTCEKRKHVSHWKCKLVHENGKLYVEILADLYTIAPTGNNSNAHQQEND